MVLYLFSVVLGRIALPIWDWDQLENLLDKKLMFQRYLETFRPIFQDPKIELDTYCVHICICDDFQNNC